jgi:hypothetical protein
MHTDEQRYAPVPGIVLAENPQGVTLRRAFLWTLILSVTSCAVIAVFTLLFARFTDTTVRILATLAAISAYSAASVFCATTLDRGLWPALSRFGLGLFAAALLLLLLAIWYVTDWETIGKLNGSAIAILIGYLYAIPGADLAERRVGVRFGALVLAAAVASLGYSLVLIWFIFPHGGEDFIVRLGMSTHVAAICLSHAALLTRVTTPVRMNLARTIAFGAIGAFGIYLCAFLLLRWEGDFQVRLLGALGVMNASATISLLILSRLRRVEERESRLVAQARIELACPRCATRQVVTSGETACSACGLRIRIEIEEPRCAGCHYPLWNLRSRRCPECGRAF